MWGSWKKRFQHRLGMMGISRTKVEEESPKTTAAQQAERPLFPNQNDRSTQYLTHLIIL